MFHEPGHQECTYLIDILLPQGFNQLSDLSLLTERDIQEMVRPVSGQQLVSVLPHLLVSNTGGIKTEGSLGLSITVSVMDRIAPGYIVSADN